MGEISPGHRPKRQPPKKKRGGAKAKNTGAKQRGPKVDPTKTGRALRQEFASPTYDELLAGILATVTPLNGPDTVGSDAEHGLFEQFNTKFDDRDVLAVFDAVRHSGVVERVEALIEAAKKQPGRPIALPYRALVVGMLLTAIDGKGCLCTEIARTLYQRLRPSSMRLLGLTPFPEATTRLIKRRQIWTAQKRVRDALRRFLSVLDPSIHPKGHEMPYVALRKKDRPLTQEEIMERHQHLTWVCNTLLRIPFELLPAKVKRKYRGSACVDATPMRVATKRRSVKKEIAPSDPDTGNYGRDGDHTEDSAVDWTKTFPAYDINLMSAVCDWLGDRQYLPALPLAVHLGRPGTDPAGAFRRMAATLTTVGHQPRYLAGDGIYANATPDTFHDPARKGGWQMVLPILDDHTGIQTSLEGLLMVEGDWYCPSIPQRLIDATATFRTALTNLPKVNTHKPKTFEKRAKAAAAALADYRQAIAERENYRARYKDTNTSGKQRYGCPASGSHPAVVCALKPKSEENPFIGSTTLPIRKLKPEVVPDPSTQTNGVWPKPCRQDTVSLTVSMPDMNPDLVDEARKAAARFKQDIRFGTAEHTDTYNALRQSQEGLHGFAKDDAYEALGSPGKHRVKGLAAQSLFAAVLLAAAGVRKVRSFLFNALTDENGDLYVPRRKRKGEHARTHLPPGTKGTRGDPDYDAEPVEEEAA